MLKKIKIKGYKSFKNLGVSLSNLSVLFMPNVAGKSNLVDALQLLSRIAMSRTLKEAFDPPYHGKPIESITLPERGIKGLLEQESATFEIEIEVKLKLFEGNIPIYLPKNESWYDHRAFQNLGKFRATKRDQPGSKFGRNFCIRPNHAGRF